MTLQISDRERPHILIVDDEDDILDLLQYNLRKEGYDTSTARDGLQAIEAAERIVPDVIILDIMMPRLDGVQACKRIRESSRLKQIPVLMLTAKSEEIDQVKGLDTGADIYLTKPISVPVLISQVKALLRGSNRFDTPSDILRVLDLVIDRDRFEVRRQGLTPPVRLARKEFDLLYFFASRPGIVFSRQELLDRVWGHDVYVVDRTVDVHVRKIREKIGDHYIETVKGVGYRFKDEPAAAP